MMTEQRVSIQLAYLAKELLHDIANYAYVEGLLMQEGVDENARHTTIDVIQDGNIERVLRVLTLAHSEVLHLLHPYTKTPVEDRDMSFDNIPSNPDVYLVDLSLPIDMPASTVELLRHQIHEYLVLRALSDWVEITRPDRLQVWQEKLERCKDAINRFKHYRTGAIRRVMRPF